MNIAVNKSTLATEMAKVLPFVERKSTIPILANVLLQAAGNSVTLTCTDLEATLRATITAQVESEGSITVPARKLAETLKKLKTLEDANVTIKTLENNWVELTCGPLKVKLVGMDAKNFPTAASVPSEPVQIQADVLLTLIDRTRHAIAQEESRYTINGALLLLKPDSITMVATDGHRLAYVQHLASVAREIRTLIPSDTLDKLRTLLADAETVNFASDHEKSLMVFTLDARTLISRELTGQFPNYEAVMPKYSNRTLIVPAASLAASLNRVASFADERSHAIRFELQPNTLKVAASSSDLGDASETVPASYDDSPLAIGLNAEYVLDYLKTYKNGASIAMQARDPQSAVLFTPAQDDDYVCREVVMPMRL